MVSHRALHVGKSAHTVGQVLFTPPPPMHTNAQQAYAEALKRVKTWQQQGDSGVFLNLSGLGLTTLPPEIGQLTALRMLDLANNQLSTLPPEILRLVSLTHLFLHWNSRLGIPDSVLGPSIDAVYGLDTKNRKDPRGQRTS